MTLIHTRASVRQAKPGTAAETGAARKLRRQRQHHGIGAGNRWMRWIAPTGGAAALRLTLETGVTTLLVCGALRLLAPADPLLIGSGFGWPWLVPLVLALRRGTVQGILSSALLAGVWLLCYGDPPAALRLSSALPQSVPPQTFPREYFLGGFVAVMIAGQFGDVWMNRLRQARTAHDYLSERLAILTRSQFLLRLSHERLEQDLLSKPATLRDALTRLRMLTLDEAGPDAAPAASDGAVLPGAQRFLEAAAQACQLDRARVYGWCDGALASAPSASLGAAFDCPADDPLVRHAVDTLELAHLKSADLRADAPTQLIAAAPLVDAQGTLLGVLAVGHMPFLALTRDNLQFLLVMCGYYADGVRHAALTADVLTAFPHCPYDFALDFARLVHLRRTTGIVSSLVALVFDDSDASLALYEHVLRSRRALDMQWSIDSHGRRAALTLMALSGDAAVDGYLMRIEDNLHAQFGVDFERARVAVYSMVVPVDGAIDALRAFVERCHVGD